MDDVALFGSSLSQSQVLSLYAAGSGITYSPASITTQPNSQTNNVGQTAQFLVAASGLPAPTYHWQTNGVNLTDGGNISGSTTTNLVISNLSITNAGNYTVVVSNGLASVTSTVATLTVLTAPPVVYLTNHLSGTSMVLSWPQGTLLQATNLTGPWVTNTATSPYTLSPTNPVMFYRIRVQ
jgi:hypothetical protein